MASLGSEKLGLEQRLADRVCEVASLTLQLQQAQVQFEHYQASVAQQRSDERLSAEQRQHGVWGAMEPKTNVSTN